MHWNKNEKPEVTILPLIVQFNAERANFSKDDSTQI